MANFNKVLLMGNLTRDPQLRYTPSQAAVCDFGLAINRKWKAQDGQMKEEVCFVDCTAWGRTGENISKYMTKGRPLFVEGRLTYQTWDGKDGQKRSKLLVTVENFQFIDSKGGGGGAGPAGGRAGPSQDAKRQPTGQGPSAAPGESSGAANQAPPPAGGEYDYSQDVEDDTIPF
jgi:single-strand DNA-binding protein